MSATEYAQTQAAPIEIDQRLAAIEALLVELVENQVTGDQQIRVRDVSMSLGAMVIFMVKWAFAAVPAAIIVFSIAGFLLLLFGSVLEQWLHLFVQAP